MERIERNGGFGFIAGEDGTEPYVQANSVLHGGFVALEPGAGVVYHVEEGDERPHASTKRPS